mgnify:CR=1 FL=1
MDTPSAVSEIKVKRIDNGFVVTWTQQYDAEEQMYAFHEYYTQSFFDLFEKVENIFKR